MTDGSAPVRTTTNATVVTPIAVCPTAAQPEQRRERQGRREDHRDVAARYDEQVREPVALKSRSVAASSCESSPSASPSNKPASRRREDRRDRPADDVANDLRRSDERVRRSAEPLELVDARGHGDALRVHRVAEARRRRAPRGGRRWRRGPHGRPAAVPRRPRSTPVRGGCAALPPRRRDGRRRRRASPGGGTRLLPDRRLERRSLAREPDRNEPARRRSATPPHAGAEDTTPTSATPARAARSPEACGPLRGDRTASDGAGAATSPDPASGSSERSDGAASQAADERGDRRARHRSPAPIDRGSAVHSEQAAPERGRRRGQQPAAHTVACGRISSSVAGPMPLTSSS